MSNLLNCRYYIKSICPGQCAELLDPYSTDSPVKSLPFCLPACLSIFFVKNAYDLAVLIWSYFEVCVPTSSYVHKFLIEI